jgi:UDP-N-acetylglucosamine 2-epimerase (non-hydrolysing)
MIQKPLALVLGIRPDVIRASILIRELRKSMGENFLLIWSGQHYSDNLKDVFFRELGIAAPEIELSIQGETDAELSASMISQLSKCLREIEPKLVVFLGDTNTVIGTVAAAQLNIPIVHIEGCMRSYDWRMPEEKYRTIADHLSDRIYAYLPEYKEQGLAEGIPFENIVVTGNPIVDVLEEYFISGKLRMEENDFNNLLFEKYGVEKKNYYVMTSHRRENVEDLRSLTSILDLAAECNNPVLFAAGYRTQKMISEFGIKLSKNIKLFDPIGYLELLELMIHSNGVLTDSGTVVEEACILGIPTIQMRRSTERPEVYIVGSSIKFDPASDQNHKAVLNRFYELIPGSWKHTFGDGKASYRICEDLLECWSRDEFTGHSPANKEKFSSRSYM